MLEQQYVIRVYGVCLYQHYVVLSDEKYGAHYFTKFPGGGLEWGEGTIDCLKREFIEEFALNINIIKHLYTTDYFVQSAFNTAHQIISVYYLIDIEGVQNLPISNSVLPLDATQQNAQALRLVALYDVSVQHFNFPIDKKVFEEFIALQ
jgi:8-oxo-dGTP diphosphatase